MLSASTIIARYKRAKLKVLNTLVWPDITDEQKQLIQSLIRLNTGEQFAIHFYKSENYWWVTTNQRLVICNFEHVCSYPYELIKAVRLPEGERIHPDKRGIENISIELNDGSVKSLHVENASWYFIYRLLKLLRAATSKPFEEVRKMVPCELVHYRLENLQ